VLAGTRAPEGRSSGRATARPSARAGERPSGRSGLFRPREPEGHRRTLYLGANGQRALEERRGRGHDPVGDSVTRLRRPDSLPGRPIAQRTAGSSSRSRSVHELLPGHPPLRTIWRVARSPAPVPVEGAERAAQQLRCAASSPRWHRHRTLGLREAVTLLPRSRAHQVPNGARGSAFRSRSQGQSRANDHHLSFEDWPHTLTAVYHSAARQHHWTTDWTRRPAGGGGAWPTRGFGLRASDRLWRTVPLYRLALPRIAAAALWTTDPNEYQC